VWFVRIVDLCVAETVSTDNYGHKVVPGQSFIIGNFIEKSRNNNKGFFFKLQSKTTYFYLESIVYPFAQFYELKNEYYIENAEYLEIINFVEHHHYLHCD